MERDKTFRVLITPDKFRGSLNATQVCETIEQAFRELQQQNQGKNELNFKISKLQLADGGQGSLETIQKHLPHLTKVQILVKNPLFHQIQSQYLVDQTNSIAYIQMAKSSGLALLNPKDRNPLNTTTFGVGQMISDAISKKFKHILLFIGGSATNDAGIGMAAALGFKFLDQNQNQITPIGSSLIKVHQIIQPSKQVMENILSTDISVISDVQNVFFGPNGAAYIYGPQKGADPKAIDQLDQGLQSINEVFKAYFHRNLEQEKGSGAAGGLGGGALLFINAKMKKGIQKVMEILNYEQKVMNCDLVITGEGKLDKQSLAGKVVLGVIKSAQKYQKRVWIVCGINELNQKTDLIPIYDKIIVISLVDDKTTQQQAISNCRDLIKSKLKRKLKQYKLSL